MVQLGTFVTSGTLKDMAKRLYVCEALGVTRYESQSSWRWANSIDNITRVSRVAPRGMDRVSRKLSIRKSRGCLVLPSFPHSLHPPTPPKLFVTPRSHFPGPRFPLFPEEFLPNEIYTPPIQKLSSFKCVVLSLKRRIIQHQM